MHTPHVLRRAGRTDPASPTQPTEAQMGIVLSERDPRAELLSHTVPTTLWRAFAYVQGSDWPEVMVFFEAGTTESQARRMLFTLLAVVWAVPPHRVDAYNLSSEHELLETHALGTPETGDARLFEVGFGPSGAHYADVSRTQLLVGPKLMPRLVSAQNLAALLSTGGTVPARRAA
jgi:hypothetical protein